MTIQEAKDAIAVKHNFSSWSEFRTKGMEEGFYNQEKYEYLEEAFEIYAEELCKMGNDMKGKIRKLENEIRDSKYFHDKQKRNYGEAYRKLISESIAGLTAVQMLFEMNKLPYTHANKAYFADHAKAVIEQQRIKLRDEYKTGSWKFGEGFTNDELPF